VVKDETGNYVYQGTGPTDYPQVWLDKDWTDYALELKIRIVKGSVFICTRADRGRRFYTAHISTTEKRINLAKYSQGKYVLRLAINYRPVAGTWYLVRIEVKGTEYRLYLNNQLLATLADNDFPLLQGGIGFYMGGGDTVEFDDIRVWSLK
jgi:hypothetical protein